ncbi:lysophospholipase [Ancylostoma ceylanicum]|uniref:Phospholipase B-like n=1 Tax=Ancylostoma ceylanicum TaxID=53326 RepID=A0A0D6M6U9_9BILA|nr:lysophospholipase [Ancylostoma ceylanicum]
MEYSGSLLIVRVPPLPKAKNPHGSSRFNYTYLSVCQNGTDYDSLEIVHAKECEEKEAQIALGKYTNQVNTTGWGILEIETFSGHPYDVQAYAAGVAEEFIVNAYTNTSLRIWTGCVPKYSQSRRLICSGDMWVNLTFAQLTGIYDSYMKRNLTPEIGFDLSPIYMIQLSGELFDLNKYLNKTPDPQEYPESGRCSGLVKLAPGNKDMFFSHVAMSSLSWMMRVLKLYKFAFDAKEVPGHTVTFSGYPGQLASADDYTLTSGGLVCFPTPKKWVELFSRYNSGTYNNQWTVVDYKLFKPGKEIPGKDMLWILEQTPGSIRMEDVTWFLKKYSYWPSYNVPFIKDITMIAGFSEKARQFDWYKWGASPRARIFDRDHNKVVDIDTLTKLMRYNDYTHEEFARCNCTPLPYTAEGGISARGDLNTPNGTYEVESMGFRDHAGLDYKGTNYEMFSKLRFRAWGGPPYDPLPVFDWSTTKVVANHFGQPQVWNFTYVDLEWETKTNVLGFEDVDESD